MFYTSSLKTEEWGVHRPAGHECDGQLDWHTRRSRARVLVVKATCLASQLCFPALEHPMQNYQWSWSRNCGKSCHRRTSREPFGSILRQRLFGRAQIGDIHVFTEKRGILCVWLPAKAIQSFQKIGRIPTYQFSFRLVWWCCNLGCLKETRLWVCTLRLHILLHAVIRM